MKQIRDLSKNHLRKWEIALLLALCAALLSGLWAQGEQRELSERLIRLHVIADSDEPQAQSAKLLARDRVLLLLEPALEGVTSAREAQEIIEQKLPEIAVAAAEAASVNGEDISATAELGSESYPTRVYDGFSLPAGEYTSLRVTLGEGEGKNWWCVVFPPLCAQAAGGTDTDALSMLPDEDVALISDGGEGYVVKFRVLELWGKLTSLFR